MDLKALREACGFKQQDIVNALAKDGIKVNKSDISRLENGIVESYLFLGHKIAEYLIQANTQEKTKQRAEGQKNQLQLTWEERSIYEYLLNHGSIDYPTAKIRTAQDDRGVRSCISKLKTYFPIVERQRGWALAGNESDIDKQLAIYEKKKRLYSSQEAPLIALRYDLRRVNNANE